ncbi:Gamma-glutamyl-CDP-amidate hydrolase [Actinosynnema sp. ALI-1.44]
MKVGISQRVLPVRADELRDSLDQRWTPLLESLGCVPVPLPTLVSDPAAYARQTGIDAVILSGGEGVGRHAGAPEWNIPRDRFELALLAWAVDHRIPVVGVCRGFQLLVARWGGALRRAAGHAGATHDLRWATGERGPEAVLSHHDWVIDRLPTEFRAVARAADDTVEAATHRTLPLVGMMWHPERDGHPCRGSEAFLAKALRGGR